MKFKNIDGMEYPFERSAARAWNRCDRLRDEWRKDPTPENLDALEKAALDWVEKSARAGRALWTLE